MKHILNYETLNEASKKDIIAEFEEVCYIFMEYAQKEDAFNQYKRMIFIEKDVYKDILVEHEEYFIFGEDYDDSKIKLSIKEKDKILYNLIVKDKRFYTDKSSENTLWKLVKEYNVGNQHTKFLPVIVAPLFETKPKLAKKLIDRYYTEHSSVIKAFLASSKKELFDIHTKTLNMIRDYKGIWLASASIDKFMSQLYEHFKDELSTRDKLDMMKSHDLLYKTIIEYSKNFYNEKDKYLDDLSKLGIFDDDD